MIAIGVALLSMATSDCGPVLGADQLWRSPIKWVIVGELHGTSEAPAAFANLVCLAAASGRPVVVAIEYSQDRQSMIDTYLASDGGAKARAAFLTIPEWNLDMQDGRGSVAVLRLWDRLRRMKQSGRIKRVVASDVGHLAPPGQDRDAAMARNWTAIPVPKNGIVIALVGNLHAMRRPMTLAGSRIVTAASLMERRRTMTVNIVGNGGKAWNCQEDGCGSHDSGLPRRAATGVTLLKAADRGWDAVYELGTVTTAALPAKASPMVTRN